VQRCDMRNHDIASSHRKGELVPPSLDFRISSVKMGSCNLETFYIYQVLSRF
jgi:hypothetical protein